MNVLQLHVLYSVRQWSCLHCCDYDFHGGSNVEQADRSHKWWATPRDSNYDAVWTRSHHWQCRRSRKSRQLHHWIGANPCVSPPSNYPAAAETCHCQGKWECAQSNHSRANTGAHTQAQNLTLVWLVKALSFLFRILRDAAGCIRRLRNMHDGLIDVVSLKDAILWISYWWHNFIQQSKPVKIHLKWSSCQRSNLNNF